MCGRYGTIMAPRALLAGLPNADFPLTIDQRWNIAPSQDVLALRRLGGRTWGELLRWGIALPPESGRRRDLINVRAETALTGGWRARLLEGQRVLLPASHFFEWRGSRPRGGAGASGPPRAGVA